MSKIVNLAAAANNGDISLAATKAGLMGDVGDAAYRVAHQFPGGVPALAQRMGMSPNTLSHKVSLTNESHKLSLSEAVYMQHVANRFDILYAMAESLGHVCLAAPEMGETEVTGILAKVGAEVGDVFREVQRVLADGRVTPNERRKVAAQVAEAITALCAVMKVL